MDIKYKLIIILLSGIIFSSSINAGEVIPSQNPRVYVEFGLRQAFDIHLPSAGYTVMSNAGGDINTPIFASFLISPKEHSLPNNLTLEAGLLWKNLSPADSPYIPFVSLGVHYQYSNFDQKGTLMDTNSLLLDLGLPPPQQLIGKFLYQAHYQLLQRSLLANLKMDLYRWGPVMPYINLGLGTSWNKSKRLGPLVRVTEEEQPGPEPQVTEFLLTPPASQVTNFSYQLGAGLDFLVTENFWLSLGYSYNNFDRVKVTQFVGSAELGPFPLIEVTPGIKQPFNFRNLTSQTIQLTGRYVFG